MGIYDRDYYRTSREAGSSLWPQSAVGNIILICTACYLLDWLFFQEDHRLTQLLALKGETLFRPWQWWQFVTYGFAHDPAPFHILFNMLQLFFLGREVEARYGTREFYFLYLTMIILGGIVHSLVNLGQSFLLVGASGAVCGIVLLFVLNNPFATLVLLPIPIPVPAWIIGALLVVGNVLGALSPGSGVEGSDGPEIAFVVHLTGLAFAYLYFRFRWRLSRLWAGFRIPRLIPPRGFRVVRPDEPDDQEERERQELEALEEEVDRILEKISRFGEASLTRRERRTLEEASRRLRSRRQRDRAPE